MRITGKCENCGAETDTEAEDIGLCVDGEFINAKLMDITGGSSDWVLGGACWHCNGPMKLLTTTRNKQKE